MSLGTNSVGGGIREGAGSTAMRAIAIEAVEIFDDEI